MTTTLGGASRHLLTMECKSEPRKHREVGVKLHALQAANAERGEAVVGASSVPNSRSTAARRR